MKRKHCLFIEYLLGHLYFIQLLIQVFSQKILTPLQLLNIWNYNWFVNFPSIFTCNNIYYQATNVVHIISLISNMTSYWRHIDKSWINIIDMFCSKIDIASHLISLNSPSMWYCYENSITTKLINNSICLETICLTLLHIIII
jgi:hypothetical protein